MNPQPEPLSIGLEGELTTRRPVTVEQHKLWLDSLLTPEDQDELDSLVQELRETQSEGGR